MSRTWLLFTQHRTVPVIAALFLVTMLSTSTAIIPVQSQSTQPDSTVLSTRYSIHAAAARSGWNTALHAQLADLLWATGDTRGAAAHWAQAGDDPFIVRRLAQTYIELGQWSDAARALDHLLSISPESSWAHYQLGTLIAPTDPIRALDYLQTAATKAEFAALSASLIATLETYAAAPDVALRIGRVFSERGLWPYAERAFVYSAALNAPDPLAIAYTGYSRARQGKSGLDWTGYANTLAPDTAQVSFLHGLTLRESGALEESLDAFIRAVQLAPQTPAYYAELGATYTMLTDYETAIYWLELAVNISGDAEEYREMLARYYAEYGSLIDSPAADLSSLAASLPDDADLITSFGWTLYSDGNIDAAREQLQRAHNLEPENSTATYYLALFYVETGDFERALPLLEALADGDSLYADQARQFYVVTRTPIPSDTPETP
ncbi:MAG: tetratricopeptide repeat protein [Chloroflexota bacterium]